ncbi:Ig-like domain repeat protein [Luteimicrobium sp. DT211]|uniref:Ig-like domain-containing protein n=1 Tax=Luteimicrobium sp. DT211 TaxID=3393412 RepID=UPI003CEBF524
MRRRRRTISLASTLVAGALTLSLTAPAVAASPSANVTSPSADGRDDTLPYTARTTPPASPVPAPDSLLRTSSPDGLSPLATTTSVHQLDIVVATPTGKTSAVTDADVDSLVSDVSTYWSGQTNGRVAFHVKTIKRISTGANCSTDDGLTTMWTQGSKAVAGKDWWDDGNPDVGPPAREHLVVLYPYAAGDSEGATTCDGTLGLGTTPTTPSLGNNGLTFALFGAPDAGSNHASAPQFYTSRQSLAHELGHNFGLQHAGFWWCDSGASDGAFTSSACGQLSYWDPLDLMGAGFGDKGIPPLSSPQRLRLGLLTTAQHKTVTASSTQVVTALPASQVGAPARPQVVQVKDPKTGDVYDVEYRPSMPGVSFPAPAESPFDTYTVDGTGSYRIGFGVRVLRFTPRDTDYWARYEQSVVPVGGASSRTSYLATGHTFTTRSGKVSFKVTTTNGATATLAVVVHKTPEVSLTRSTRAQRYRQTAVRLTARVGSVDGRHATGTVAFKDGSHTLKTVRTSSVGTAAYTLPKTLAVRTHTLTAAFTPDAASKARGVDATSKRTTVKVTRASAAASVKLAHTTVRKGAKPKITVRVSVKGISKPTGTIKLYENGHKVKTVKLTSSKKGKVTVTLPRTTKRGTVKIVAKYSGSSTVAARTTKAATLKVR